ncbi:MAG: ABC transporter substrate-binding protein, partial [Spirochaetes bacterium]|nr:ABC transporter substrate-binding protein [Spirochaetota bacterium]
MKRIFTCISIALLLLVVGQGLFAATTYKEAPALAAQVKAGKLPAVAKRLPQNPLVVKPDKIGTYGGTWRMGMTS